MTETKDFQLPAEEPFAWIKKPSFFYFAVLLAWWETKIGKMKKSGYFAANMSSGWEADYKRFRDAFPVIAGEDNEDLLALNEGWAENDKVVKTTLKSLLTHESKDGGVGYQEPRSCYWRELAGFWRELRNAQDPFWLWGGLYDDLGRWRMSACHVQRCGDSGTYYGLAQSWHDNEVLLALFSKRVQERITDEAQKLTRKVINEAKTPQSPIFLINPEGK